MYIYFFVRKAIILFIKEIDYEKNEKIEIIINIIVSNIFNILLR